MNEAGDRERAILEAASRLPPKERAAFLDKACGLEDQLRQRVLKALYEASMNATTAPARLPDPDGGTIVVHPSSDSAGEQPGEVIGSYRLLEKLGEGGMGSVWVAEQRQTIHRKVALKVIKLGMDTKHVIARFEAERQALALMDHPNIAKVFDAGATDKGRPYFVMELVSGVRITDYCDRHNVPTRQRLELFVQVCQAVAHAHQKGIVHRDIKPPNILVSVYDNKPSVRIIDFGIAKAMAGQRLTEKTVYTAFEEFIGTPAYMSPEQAEMNPLGIDARTDVYALGVLLYELLTGLTPFESERFRRLGPDEIRRIIREEEPPRPSTKLTTLHADEQAALARHHQCDAPKLLHLVRGDLDWIVMKCLDKDRTRRYQTADALAEDVQRYLRGETIVARPPSQLYRLSKLVRRHKPALAVAAVTLLVTCGALALVALVWPGMLSRRPEGYGSAQRLARANESLMYYDRAGAISNAIFELEEGLKSDPQNAHLWAKLGWANWLKFGEDERDDTKWDAQRCSANALTYNPKEPEGHLVQGVVSANLNDWAAATNHLLRAKESTRTASGLVLVSLASACQGAGDRTGAQAYARLAGQAKNNSWDVYDRLGVFYYKSGGGPAGLECARTNIEEAVRLAPNSPTAHRHLADILLLQKRPDDAMNELKLSLSLRPLPQTYSAMGSVSMVKRQYIDAAHNFQKAMLLDGANFKYAFNAGLAFRKAGQTDRAGDLFRVALQQTEDRIRGGGSNVVAQAFRGLCHAGLGEEQQARENLEAVASAAGASNYLLGLVRDGYKMLNDSNRVAEIERSLQSTNGD